MTRWDLINYLVKKNGYTRYLEIGVADGATFTRVEVQTMLGVDPDPNSRPDDARIVHMKSDSFFDSLSPDTRFDIIFIDGYHEYHQAKRDILNAARFLADKGTIVVHDCLPEIEENQIVPAIIGMWTGDVWKAIVDLRASERNLNIRVLNSDWGLGVITKEPNEKPYLIPAGMTLQQVLKWEYFKDRKIDMLNLIPVGKFTNVKDGVHIIGVFYTHNKINASLLNASLNTIKEAQEYSNLQGVNTVEIIAAPWEKLPWPKTQYPSFFKHNGHLNICTQILRVLYNHKSDLVCFLEHDCLYPVNYFERVAEAFMDNPEALAISNLDYIGLNETGYLAVKERHEPMSQLSMPHAIAKGNLERGVVDCIKEGWCYVEPNDKTGFVRLPYLGNYPSVHVNMNHTKENHHFTNHYGVCYEDQSSLGKHHPYWGDMNRFNIFAEKPSPNH